MVSARPEKDQRWVEGVCSSWEDIRNDGREEGGEASVGGEEEEFGGYLSNLWVGHQRGVGSEQIYQEGKKAGSTGVKHTEAPLRGLPLV